MLGTNPYQQPMTGARFSRRTILVVVSVALLLIIFIVSIIGSQHHDSSGTKNKKIVTAETSIETATIGNKTAGSKLTISYPTNWTIEKNKEDTGGETASVKSPNGLVTYLAANVQLAPEEDDGVQITKIGAPFVVNGANYQLVAASAPSEDEDASQDDLLGIYITTPDATSRYLTTGAQQPDGTIICDAYGILNPVGDQGAFAYSSPVQLQSDPDYETSLSLLKKALAERQ